MKFSITALGRPISIKHPTNKIVVLLLFVTLILTVGIYTFRGESFTSVLVSSFSSAGVLFLSWAVGRELDPANDWSAFVSLPFIIFAFFIAGHPHLLSLFFIILCCRLLNRACGLQPFKSDAVLLFVMAVFLYQNSLYFALPYLALALLIDSILKPADSFNVIIALVGSASYLVVLLVYRPDFALSIPETIAFNFSAAAIIIVLLSVVFVSYITRHDRVLDDLRRAELNNRRVNAARFLAAVWIIAEILRGGLIILHQIYPVVVIFGGVFLYHLVGLIIKKSSCESAGCTRPS